MASGMDNTPNLMELATQETCRKWRGFYVAGRMASTMVGDDIKFHRDYLLTKAWLGLALHRYDHSVTREDLDMASKRMKTVRRRFNDLVRFHKRWRDGEY